MRIQLVTQYFWPEVGAAQTRLDAVTRILTEMGHEVDVITAMPSYPTPRVFGPYRRKLMMREQRGEVRIRRTPTWASMGAGWKRMASYAIFSVGSLLGMIGSRRPEVIVIESPPLILVAPTMIAARLRRVPVVLNIADLWPDAAVAVGALRPGRLLRSMYALERWAYRHAMLVTTVTDGLVARLTSEKSVPADKIVLLPNGADVDMFDPSKGDVSVLAELDVPSGPFAVYAGTMGYVHGVDALVEGFLRAPADAPYLLLVGSGSERARLEQLAASGTNARVVFRDPIPPEDLARLLPLAEAGAVTVADLEINRTSRPAKLFPLMASGLPILFSGAGEGANAVREADVGLVVDNDVDAVLAGIAELFDTGTDLAAMGERSRQYVAKHWAWRPLVESWEAVVREHLDSRGKRRVRR